MRTGAELPLVGGGQEVVVVIAIVMICRRGRFGPQHISKCCRINTHVSIPIIQR